MDFAPQARHAPKHYGQYAAVALLHVGLVYVLSVGLKTPPFMHQASPPIVDVTPVTVPKERPKDIVPKVQEVTLDPHVTIPDFDVQHIDSPTPVNITLPPIGTPGTIDIRPDAPVGQIVVDRTTTPAATAAASCSNYGAVKDWLGDRFPAVADRSGFADRGITHFDMTVQLTLGPNGELVDQIVAESSNPYAARAMQSTVSAGLHQLQCKGVGHSQTLRVPLSFTLSD